MRKIENHNSIDLTNIDTRCLKNLVWHLNYLGYGEYYSSFIPLTPRHEQWLSTRDCIHESLRPLIDLFLLGLPVDKCNLDSHIQSILPNLIRLGIINEIEGSPDLVQTNRLSLIPVFGVWIFCDWPQINPSTYFGDDTIALLSRLKPVSVAKHLDLCTGPGTLALYCARISQEVTGVDTNPHAIRLARVNAILNNLESHTSFLVGDLYEPVNGLQFDYVTANPPILPIPETLSYPYVGRGGKDGLAITSRILKGLKDVLEEKGSAQVIGTTLSDGFLPIFIDELRNIAKAESLDITMTITSHSSLSDGSDFFNGLTSTISLTTGKELLEVQQIYSQFLVTIGGSHLCAFYLHIRHGKGAYSIQDLSKDENPGFWYILR